MLFSLFHITVILTFGSIGLAQNPLPISIHEPDNDNFYTVVKIDEKGPYHVIYLKKNNQNFKAISKKTSISNSSEKIEVCNNYELTLTPLINRTITIGDKKISLGISCTINCIILHNDTWICRDIDKGFYDVYEIKNLNGLCIRTD